ncbi:hypothetical protein ACTXMB_15185 [Arthrobacter rhombi]|uniref:hypothetical protein n=1 Tax=Arthrobacter rhombi TaxID=71253 RepID=UPI003FD4B90D
MTPTTSDPTNDYRNAVATAYATALHIHPDDMTEQLRNAARSALITRAPDDATAAQQAGITEEQLAHDRVTLNATDGLPLIITATTTRGRFYFSRPEKGWPRPGHRLYYG